MIAPRAEVHQEAVRTDWVDVVIEVPRGSFVKRDGRGRVEFFSLLPCPVNYGSIAGSNGPDGDPLDAVVLGRRLERGARVKVPVRGTVFFFDRGIEDFKQVCSHEAVTAMQWRRLLLFFRFYGLCKRGMRFRTPSGGLTGCRGWSPWPRMPTLG